MPDTKYSFGGIFPFRGLDAPESRDKAILNQLTAGSKLTTTTPRDSELVPLDVYFLHSVVGNRWSIDIRRRVD